MRVLLAGAYGFIGLAIARELHGAGHAVAGLGRTRRAGESVAPYVAWRRADMANLQDPTDWRPFLEGIDAVVNAAGALQDGPRDDLGRVHHGAVAALATACGETGSVRLVQVSAVGARPDASTEFMRSKARGDAAIRASAADWVILRPGLVLGREASGGSALLRALASLPLVVPLALPASRIQVVALEDVARVVREAVEGRIPSRREFDLVEDQAHSLREIAQRLRASMGMKPGLAVEVPRSVAALIARAADLLGSLGWRTPLRTTALTALSEGVLGDPGPLRAVRGEGLRSLEQLTA